MPQESKASRRARVVEVCARMDALYPDAECALHFEDAFQCVICVALSAQTTDANVNKVTPELFSRWPNPAAMAQAPVEEVEDVIRSIGFFRNKARTCVNCARMIMTDFNGEVPASYEGLQKLPGVGRKTANIVMNNVFGVVEGIAVDTHVNRIAHKLGLVVPKRETDPNKVETQLLDLIPRELWGPVNHQWVLFGREYCDAKRPRCGECPLADICPSAGK